MKYVLAVGIIVLFTAAVCINNIHADSIIPEPYDPAGKIDPFATIEKPIIVAQAESITVAQNVVPDTPLTRWSVGQLELTSIMVGTNFGWAFFKTPDNARAYKGVVGDYIGKDGITIESITIKCVVLSDGTVINAHND